jgi:type VII secretion-associated serine protease mycosin
VTVRHGVGRLATVGVVAAISVAAPAFSGPAQAVVADCVKPATKVATELPWAQARLTPEAVWHLTRGAGVTVAVVDSGVDAAVPQLSGRVVPGPDLGAGRADSDCTGHGTFAAGLIAARPVAGVPFVGVAPDATILSIRYADGAQDGATARLAEAVRVAVDAGARVVCVCAEAFDAGGQLRDAIRYASARDVLVVAASPATPTDGPRPDPDVLRDVLAVGAIDKTGAAVHVAGLGVTDLVAPGADVTSVGPAGPGHWVSGGRGYAAAFVAATAALVRAYHTRLTAAQVERRLEATADHPGGTLPDARLGWGVVNPYAAVTFVLPEEYGAVAARRSPPPNVPVLRPAAPNPAAALAGLATAGVAVGLSIVASVAALAVRRGRARRWRAPQVRAG